MDNTTDVDEDVDEAAFSLSSNISITVYSLTAVRVLWSLLAIFGNTLTIIAVIRFENLQRTSNYFICSLAAADLISSILIIFEWIQEENQDNHLYVPFCLLSKSLNVISAQCNILAILSIAIDRFMYIKYPLRYPLMVKPQVTFAIIILTWAFVWIQTPLIMVFGSHLTIGVPCKFSVFLSKTIYFYYYIPQVFICLLITICCYIAIAGIAHAQARRIAAVNQPYDTLEASTLRVQKKIAKMMFMVLASYMVSWLPQIVVLSVLSLEQGSTIQTLELVSALVFYSNSWINPIIYAWKSQEFRIAFKKILIPNYHHPFDWEANPGQNPAVDA